MKGTILEVDEKREAREKRMIRIPKRYLPFSKFYSAVGRKSTRSIPKKKLVRARHKPYQEQRLAQTANRKEPGQASSSDETEKARLVQKMETTPTPNPSVKRWVRLMLLKNDDDYNKLVGLQCKIYWPLDEKWYSACIKEYNKETGYHHVMYDDGDEEDVLLSREKIQFLISQEEEQQLRFSPCSTTDSDDLNDFDKSHELGPGDVTWAKLTGHSAWPALVLDEELVSGCKGLLRKGKNDQKSYPVQFFGTHDLARVKKIETTPFLKGFVSCLHHKCKKPSFVRGIEEAKLYLIEEKLPVGMLLMQNDTSQAEISQGASQDEDDDDEVEEEEEEEEEENVDSKDDDEVEEEEENVDSKDDDEIHEKNVDEDEEKVDSD